MNIKCSKDTLKNVLSNGLPKGQAVIWSLILSVIGYLLLTIVPSYSNWLNVNSFFLVWLIFMKMIHSPALDKKQATSFDYKSEEKDFLDNDDMIEFFKKRGEEGWEVMSFKEHNEVNLRFLILFKKTITNQ